MAYNQFTINTVIKRFNVEIVDNEILFPTVKPVVPSSVLTNFLERSLPLGSAIGTEKARSEFIIAPVLSELVTVTTHLISLFSGVEFNVDPEKELTGRCDFLISASSLQYSVTAPVLVVVEAKNENINAGLGQCMAEMIAAQLFNQQEGNDRKVIYGSVTTGSVWKFLKLEGNKVYIDKKEYFIESLNLLLGILLGMVTS